MAPRVGLLKHFSSSLTQWENKLVYLHPFPA
jgi:hypothetical protein